MTIVYISDFKTTYEVKGFKQVVEHEVDEKRAYTLCVFNMLDEQFLPFQLIYNDQSMQSISNATASEMLEARSLGFDFTFANEQKK